MPLTPLIGISVLVHIAVIAVGKLMRKDRTVYYTFVEPRKLTYVVGCLIIFSIFSFVLFTAGMLLKASVEDSHSTFRYVENSARWVEDGVVSATPQAKAAAQSAVNAISNNLSFDTSNTTAATLALLVLVVLILPHRRLHSLVGSPARVLTFWYMTVFGLGILCVLIGAYNVLVYITQTL